MCKDLTEGSAEICMLTINRQCDNNNTAENSLYTQMHVSHEPMLVFALAGIT